MKKYFKCILFILLFIPFIAYAEEVNYTKKCISLKGELENKIDKLESTNKLNDILNSIDCNGIDESTMKNIEFKLNKLDKYINALDLVSRYMNSYTYSDNYELFLYKGKSGFLSSNEYNLIGGDKSYINSGYLFWLYDNLDYYSKDESLTNIYVRDTEYIKKDAKVIGNGSYNDPWMFNFIVTFNLNYSGASSKKIAQTLTKYKFPNNSILERDGYKFIGWFKESECTREVRTDADVDLSIDTLYACWDEE